MTSLQRHGRKGWTVVTDDGKRHEGLTTEQARALWMLQVGPVTVGDVPRITSPRPTPGEPTISDEEPS